MFSERGPKIEIFAGILAVIVLLTGVYMTFFQSGGFVKTTAMITDVRMDSSGESTVCYPTVEYTVDGKTYTTELDTGSGSYRMGQTISVLYDPGNPSAVHDGSGFGLYLIIAGAAILAAVVFSAIRENRGRQILVETRKEYGNRYEKPE